MGWREGIEITLHSQRMTDLMHISYRGPRLGVGLILRLG